MEPQPVAGEIGDPSSTARCPRRRIPADRTAAPATEADARFIFWDMQTSGFLGLRRTGYAGTDYYFIFGSPDPAGKFEPMLTVKVVKPL